MFVKEKAAGILQTAAAGRSSAEVCAAEGTRHKTGGQYARHPEALRDPLPFSRRSEGRNGRGPNIHREHHRPQRTAWHPGRQRDPLPFSKLKQEVHAGRGREGYRKATKTAATN